MTKISTVNDRWLFFVLLVGAVLGAASAGALGQVAPLAPRWLAGTPPPPVETFSAGLERLHIGLSEPELLEALRNPDGEVRSLAAAQLAAMDDHPALRQIVQAILNERDPQVQVNIAGAASWLGSHAGIAQLEQSCRDINVPSLTRLDAARYISHKRLATCFPAVRQIARTDQDAEVRVQAIIAAVGYWDQAEGAETISVRALQDVDPSVRSAAADALRRLRATKDVGALESALKGEGDETAREHMREAVRVLRVAESS